MLFFIVFVIFVFGFSDLSIAQSNTDSQVLYTDYLPKYREASDNFMISKIEYTNEKIILFYRYVSTIDDDIIHFYGADREFAWRLTNLVRDQSSSANTVTNLADVVNIRLNDESQRERLNDRSNTDVVTNKGDIITCEIHFKRLPSSARSVGLLGGDCLLNSSVSFRFNCRGILIKSKDSGQLGTKKQMIASIKRFYEKIDYVKYPDINTATTLAQQEELEKKDNKIAIEKAINPVVKHLEPIGYMPHMLVEPEDFKCSERVILTDVHFHENRPDFRARGKAMSTINMVLNFMQDKPKTKIILHGHTDVFGNAFKNLETSKQHVNLVKKVLTDKGINSSRIIAIHHGGSQALPRYKNGGSMNRRVEAEIICIGQ